MKPCQEKNEIINMASIILRLKTALEIHTNAELAKHLDVLPKIVSVWKSRNTIPTEKIIGVCLDKGLDLQYILTGLKNGELSQSPQELSSSTFPELGSIIKELNMLWTTLDQSERYELASKILKTASAFQNR